MIRGQATGAARHGVWMCVLLLVGVPSASASVPAAAGAAATASGWATSLYYAGFPNDVLSATVEGMPLAVPQFATGNGDDDISGSAEGKQISRGKAIGASLLLPGLGQLYTGHKGRATVFFVADAVIWLSFIALRVQGDVRQDRYITYAELYADIYSAQGKPDWYYRNLGSYNSSDDYEHDIARSARAIYGDDLEAREAYVARERPSPDEAWVWRANANRLEYSEMRKGSRDSYHRASLTLGLALLNRVISAVDAARLAGKSGSQALYVEPGADGTHYVGLRWNLP